MKKLSYISTSIVCAFLIWFTVSWVDIIADNTAPDPQHLDFNLFVLITNTWEESTK